MDSDGHVQEAPRHTLSHPIDCIALRGCRIYFSIVGEYDATHAVYMAKDSAAIPGYSYTYMEMDGTIVEYVMYEIPSDIDSVTIVPKRDGAEFTYMGTTYSFGEVTDETRGKLRFSTTDDQASSDEIFEIVEEPPAPANPFRDVNEGTGHFEDILWLASSGISAGWGMHDGTVEFLPYANVARADMAAFLHRMEVKGLVPETV